MNTLLIYYSFTGNNEKLANYLVEKLHCAIIKLETVRKRNGFSILLDLIFKRKPAVKPLSVHLKDFDHIIFLTPIWAGKIAMPMKSLLLNQAKNIRYYSFITACGGGDDSQKSRIEAELLSTVGRAPEIIEELWIKKVIGFRKTEDMIVSNVKVDMIDFEIFTNELESFISAVKKLENQVTLPVQ